MLAQMQRGLRGTGRFKRLRIIGPSRPFLLALLRLPFHFLFHFALQKRRALLRGVVAWQACRGKKWPGPPASRVQRIAGVG